MKRLGYYLARRYFHLSPPEWDRLVWWEQRLLLEGLTEEGILGDGTSQSTGPDSGDQFVLNGTKPGEFAAVGIREMSLN